MGKRPINRNADMEIIAIKEQLEGQEKKIDEVLILLGGSVIGKTKGLVEIVSTLSLNLDDMISKFQHAEKWRKSFKEAQDANEARNEKRRQLVEQREHEMALKERELAALRRSSMIKNWIALGSGVAGFAIKQLWDYFF